MDEVQSKTRGLQLFFSQCSLHSGPLITFENFKTKIHTEGPRSRAYPFSLLLDSFLTRAYVHVDGQSVCTFKLILNIGPRGVHNGVACSPEVRPQWRKSDLNGEWPEQSLNKEFWVPWHLECGLKREPWALVGTSSWLHVSVELWEKDLRVEPRSTVRACRSEKGKRWNQWRVG